MQGKERINEETYEHGRAETGEHGNGKAKGVIMLKRGKV